MKNMGYEYMMYALHGSVSDFRENSYITWSDISSSVYTVLLNINLTTLGKSNY